MSNAKGKQHSEERVQLKGFLAEFRKALEEEIDEIKKSGQSSTILLGGRQIESHNAEFWYCFNVEYAPALPADTPCKLIIGTDQFDVTVVSFEENRIIVSSKKRLPESLGAARLENGATILMERLIKCIEKNATTVNTAGLHMFLTEKGVYSAHRIFNYDDLDLDQNNTKNQNSAIKAALSNDITYIWGPPGTGKTTVIGQIVDELYKHNRSVLVVSHTNTAVDGAIAKADKTYSQCHEDDGGVYPILRIGIPTKQLNDRVLLKTHIDILGKELFSRKDLLYEQQSKIQSRINEISILLAKDTWINENNLTLLEETLKIISAYESELEEIDCKIEEINSVMQKEKEEHPEYTKYLALAKQLKVKESEYEAVCEHFRQIKWKTIEIPLKIQDTEDEVKKHYKYAELCAEEAKHMSLQFIRNEIAKIDSQIAIINAETSSLIAKRAVAQRTLTEYEQKSTIAKFFSGKSSVLKAQTDLQDINSRIPQAEDKLRRQKKLKSEYESELEQVLVLQDKLKAVVPSKTQEYWKNELNWLKTELSSAENLLNDLNTKKNSIHEEIQIIERQCVQIKPLFDRISDYGRKLKHNKDHAEKVKSDLVQINKGLLHLIEKERSLCMSFSHELTSKDNMLIFEELSELLDAVKLEMESVNIETLKNEKEYLDGQVLNIVQQLNEVDQKLQELEKQAIMNAKIVGCTLAKSYLSEILRERKFDTVILDEASMASIPALWCASYLAENSIVIVGDFLQLPPVVMSKTPMSKKWLGQDVFYHSGMQEKAKSVKTCPENFIMLREQFRMESDIADIANMYYGDYGGLKTRDNPGRSDQRDAFYDWYSGKRTSRHVHLIDTESLHAWVTGVPQGKKHSRFNCFSAAVDVDLAFKFLENKLNSMSPNADPEKEASVLIIAPYKPHATRLNQLIELEYRNRGFKNNLNLIKAGTVHGFQGTEADIVIFDLVIDEPHYKAAIFMESKQYKTLDGAEINDSLKKLFNVAVTRAKFKLFIVGNFSYCQKKAKNNALAAMLHKMIVVDKLEIFEAKKILPQITFTRPTDFSLSGNVIGKHIVCSEVSFYDYFLADMLSFKKRLIIFSAFMTEARLSVLLPTFVDAINAGKQIVVVTKTLSERTKEDFYKYEKCERELRNVGVNVIHKKGMHEKVIFVDNEAIWFGSLNALSFTGTTGEIMNRFADGKLISEYEKFFGIEHLCEAVENEYEQICPVCKEGEMILRESNEGGTYWQCDKGDYSRSTDQPYPINGVLCCKKCGAPYKFEMKNEPRWVCTEDKRHYQKVRASDLTLEKMEALIPSGTIRDSVDQYFTQKKEVHKTSKRNITTESAIVLDDDQESSDDPKQLTLF